MRIVLCYPVKSHHVVKIQAAWPEAEVVNAGQERVAKELFDADIFCGHAKVPVDWDGVMARGRLQWIQSSAAGMDHCLVPSVIVSPVTVTSASGVLADQVAEHTIALLTAWLRRILVFQDEWRAGKFDRLPTADLTYAKIGIAGFGGVGRRLARILSVFKTTIYATDLYPRDKPDYVEELFPADGLDTMLGLCDIVVLCLPLNALTRGIFDAARLRRIPHGGLLANMARGAIVVTEDLIDVLREGHLSGAVMDVTDPEPPPPRHPLWTAPNLLVTPHVGGQFRSRIDDMTRIFCENIRRWRAGEPLINRLTDKSLGFPIRGEVPLWTDLCDIIR